MSEQNSGSTDRGYIRVKCHDCHEPFRTDLLNCDESESGHSAARYCSDCVENGNPLKGLVTRLLTSKQVENQRICHEEDRSVDTDSDALGVFHNE